MSTHSLPSEPTPGRGVRRLGKDRHEDRAAICRAAGLCAEAQADGVPCHELGRVCETCERARQQGYTETW